MQRTAADFVLKYYAPFLKSTQHELLYVGTKMPVPKFDLDMLRLLISEATDVLRGQSSLIEIEPPVCIIGDIHGNLRDMLRIITMYFSENKYKFLFLGDYVEFVHTNKTYSTVITQFRFKGGFTECFVTLGEFRPKLTDKIKLLTKNTSSSISNISISGGGGGSGNIDGGTY